MAKEIWMSEEGEVQSKLYIVKNSFSMIYKAYFLVFVATL